MNRMTFISNPLSAQQLCKATQKGLLYTIGAELQLSCLALVFMELNR